MNSFGFGGTNAHVVLAEPPAPACVLRRSDHPPQLPPTVLPISARSEEALVATAGRLAEHLAAHPDVTLSDLGYTLGQRRTHLNHRHAVIADSIADAREQLQALADGGQIATGRTDPTAPKTRIRVYRHGPPVVEDVPGAAGRLPAHSPTASCAATESCPVTRTGLCSTSSDAMRPVLAWRRRRSRNRPTSPFRSRWPSNSRSSGYSPDAVIGHSAGEVAAHHLAGLLTFEQAIEVIYHRSRLQQRTSGQGRMLAVGLDAESLMRTIDGKALDEFGRRVSVAAINSPSAVTVAGDSDLLDDMARQLDEAGIFNRYLSVKVPYHTHYMEAVKDDLFSAFEGLSSKAAALPLYSTVTGEQLDGYQAGAAYWWQNTRATVLFEPAIRRMLEDGYTHFVELGPHPVLAASIFETAGQAAGLGDGDPATGSR